MRTCSHSRYRGKDAGSVEEQNLAILYDGILDSDLTPQLHYNLYDGAKRGYWTYEMRKAAMSHNEGGWSSYNSRL